MKPITLRIGDKLRVIQNRPFGAYLLVGDIVTIIDFAVGNSGREEEGFSCPVVQDVRGDYWYTDRKELFHNFKKER